MREKRDEHDEGFEKEVTLKEMWAHPDVHGRLNQWKDFLAVARVINPELCEDAFEPKSCRRKLRFIGHDNFDEPARSEAPPNERFYMEPSIIQLILMAPPIPLRGPGR